MTLPKSFLTPKDEEDETDSYSFLLYKTVFLFPSLLLILIFR